MDNSKILKQFQHLDIFQQESIEPDKMILNLEKYFFNFPTYEDLVNCLRSVELVL